MLRIVTLKLRPNQKQLALLERTSDITRKYYNSLLEKRSAIWSQHKLRMSVQDVEQFRKDFMAKLKTPVYSHIFRGESDILDRAFDAFFRRVKAGENPGYPRFRSFKKAGFQFQQINAGFYFKSTRQTKVGKRQLHLSNIGNIPFRTGQESLLTQGQVKTCRIKRNADGWFAFIVVELPDVPRLPKVDKEIGLDLGLKMFCVTSEGTEIQQPRHAKLLQSKLAQAQRSLQKKQDDSKNRKKAVVRIQRIHEKIVNQRRDFCHKLTNQLVRDYDLIAVEDLNLEGLMRGRFSKSFAERSCGLFHQTLTYKAESAGRQSVAINPARTSMDCSDCGCECREFTGLNGMARLKVRNVSCNCGMSLGRDHNAALNILKRAKEKLSVENAAGPAALDRRKPVGARSTETGSGKIHASTRKTSSLRA